MEIHELKLLLEDLQSVGIESAVFEPSDDKTLVRATNKDRSVVVFCEANVALSDASIALNNVNSLLSRINLFDQNKAKIEVTETDGEVDDIIIKQGRRKTVQRCSKVSQVQVPSKIPVDLQITDSNCIKITDKYVSYIVDAISSLSKTVSSEDSKISIEVDNKVCKINITDGECDSFSDELDEIDVDDVSKSHWFAAPFSRVMKRSVNEDGMCEFMITSDYGLAVFRVGIIDAIVAPAV